MNLASAWKLPVVFILENNGYGISMPVSLSCSAEELSDRAGAYGMPGMVIDGNDVVAVYEAATEAIKRARSGKGPSLVECKTYRHRGHFEGDPDVYKSKEEVAEWLAKDPIPRFEAKLVDMKVLSKKKLKEIEASLEKEVEDAVSFAEKSPRPDLDQLTEDVYTV